MTFSSNCGSLEILKVLHEMRLEAGLGPDALHAGVADPHLGRHRAHAPMRGCGRRLARRLGQHLALDCRRQRLLARRPRLVAQKPVDAFLDVALLPAPHARLRLAGALHDRVGAEPVGRRQHDPGAPDDLARAVAIRNDRFKPRPVRRAHVEADVVSSHDRTLTDLRPHGNHLSVTEH